MSPFVAHKPGRPGHYAIIILIALLVGLAIAILASRGASQSDSSFQETLELCTECHGKNGHSAFKNVPNLAGQNYDYLVAQLTQFTEMEPGSPVGDSDDDLSPIVRGIDSIRRRHSEIMEQHATGMDNVTLHALAKYFTALPCANSEASRQPRPQPQGTAWCNDCHAPTKARNMTNVPFLNSQHADYLEEQLRAFRRGAVSSDWISERFHHFMSRSVRTMSGTQIREIAEYYEAQACPGRRP